MYCSQCGNEVKDAKFCNQCGTPSPNSEPPPEQEPQEPPVQEAPTEQQDVPPENQDAPPQEAQPEQQDTPEQEAPQEQPAPQPQPMQAPPPPPPQAPQQYHPHHPPPPHHYAYPPPAQKGFIGDVFSKAFGLLFRKPVRLWGFSLLFTLLTLLAIMFGVLPILWLPVVLVLELGMANIFLCAFRGKEFSATQLFEGFNKKFTRNAGGMGWMSLWLLIWSPVPVVNCIKYYSYRFVPYIMLEDPDIKATEALKKSMVQTHGYKGKMFLTDLIISLVIVALTLIFAFAMRIPVVGLILFAIYYILMIAFAPLVVGVFGAVYYDKVSKEKPIN